MEYDELNFDNDKLGRKDFVKNLMQIVHEWKSNKHEGNLLVMSVDAPWGSGKSYLLNMWKNCLTSDENKKYCTVYYNAWENDDCENAFIHLVYEFDKVYSYEKNEKFLSNVRVKYEAFIKSCGIALMKD